MVIQTVGDGNTVVVGYAHLTLTRYLNRRAPLDQGGPRGEAALLSPYALAVPLVGRETALAELWEWMRADRPVSVRVVTAVAGAGKTRLALKLCDEAVQAGWDAGFLTEAELVRFRTVQNLAAWGWRRPTLIVVDYAASRARDLRAWLVELADHPAGTESKPLRLLLLERHAEPSGGWWREAFGYGGGDAESVARLLDPAVGPYVLPPLLTSHERRAVLTSALKFIGSAARPPELAASSGFEHQLATLSWGGEPLFLLMAGLVASRLGFGAALAITATDLGLHIARHEIDRIGGIARSRGIPDTFLAHLAAFVTLCQGLPQTTVEDLVEQEKDALRYHSAGDPPTLVEALVAALPGEPGTISPVLPDVVGEGVILQALGGGRPDKALAAVTRAARLASDKVTASLVHLAQDYGAARPEPLAWFEEIAREAAQALDPLETVLAQLPDTTLALRELATDLEQRATELTRAQEDWQGLARHLNNVSKRLSDVGRREEALVASDESVGHYRELAAARPDAFRPDLAVALNNLSNCLSDVGRREEALDACDESVGHYRELAAARPDAFRPDLAMALNNLSNRLSDVGRREEALVACDEAVGLHRELAAARPDAFRPALAMALNNLSSRLSDLGRKEAALVASDESVGHCRELAAARPDAFRPALAVALNNLSNRLSDVGRREEALDACDESVGHYRELAAARPDAFRPHLASALNNLSNCLSDLGRREEALVACDEAVDLRRELAAARPDAFRPDLASALNNLSNCLSDLGRREEALIACDEAVGHCRELAAARPDAFRPTLASALNNLSNRLGDLGRREEALVACNDAVGHLRELAAARPDAFRPVLAIALNNLSNHLSNLGRREEALVACNEAVGLRRELAAASPDAFRPVLASSLNNLSRHLSALGRKEEALVACEEAVRILTPYFLAYPAAFRGWMEIVLRVYLGCTSEAAREPDLALIGPVLAALATAGSDGDP